MGDANPPDANPLRPLRDAQTSDALSWTQFSTQRPEKWTNCLNYIPTIPTPTVARASTTHRRHHALDHWRCSGKSAQFFCFVQSQPARQISQLRSMPQDLMSGYYSLGCVMTNMRKDGWLAEVIGTPEVVKPSTERQQGHQQGHCTWFSALEQSARH